MDSPSSERPWLRAYPDWMPHDLKLTPNTALDLFRTSAAHRPENPAVFYFDQEISYREIDRFSDSLAAALRDLGLRKGDRIVLALQDIPQFIIAQYAAWKAGAIVIPLNLLFGEKELAYYIHDSRPKILIILEELLCPLDHSFLEKTSIQTIIATSPLDMFPPGVDLPPLLREIRKVSVPGTLDMMELMAHYRGKEITDPGLFPEDAAYLTYTSGAMGPVKGLMNTHGNVVFSAGVYKVSALIDENDIICAMAPFYNVAGELGLLAVAALNSVPVIMYYRFDPGEALRLVERWRATMTVAPIELFIALMNHPDIGHRDIRSFRKTYSGGVPGSPAVVKCFEEITGHHIHNLYVGAETISPSHITPLGKRMPVDEESGLVSVGLPVPNSLAKIVDPENGNAQLGPGEFGELVIRGPMVAAGYWEDAETEGLPIRDEWLYTGDMGKMDQKGWFYVFNTKKNVMSASRHNVWSGDVAHGGTPAA